MVPGDKMVVAGICEMVLARSSCLLMVLMCLRLWGTAKFYSIYRESLFVRSCSGVAFGGTESGIYKLGLPGSLFSGHLRAFPGIDIMMARSHEV